MLLGVDVGGTFTDAVLVLEDGAIVTAKAPSTPADQSVGVMAATDAVLARADRAAASVRFFAHGMTVATNALLEGRGARAALLATDGFTDIVELGRQNRADLYRLCRRGAPPLVPQELRFPVRERATPDGVLVALEDGELAELCARVRSAEPESVAVVLLHSYRHPEHERAVGDALNDALPGVHVSLSHEVVGTFREYERAATTEIDASLSPLLRSYLRRLVRRARGARLPEPVIMQSNGGLIDAASAASHAAWTVLSGPAAGAAGAAFVARAAGIDDALCLDMGGTSCDVCVIKDGEVREQGTGTVAGRPLALPMLDVHTVGAGGGSVAWCDPGGALRVGPRSAGAEPGPACYGRGGREPTVTDANLVLGYLSSDSPLAGGVALHPELAERAIATLARSLGLDLSACAEGIVRVANAEIVRALRVVTVERGLDPREHALIAFGGAGPLHAALIAEELEINVVLCPRSSGVLAALGLVVSPRRRDAQQSVIWSGDLLSAERIAATSTELGERARRALGDPDAELRATFELRYRGQAFELAVDAAPDSHPEGLRAAFERQHLERYGYSDPEQELELVTVRVSARGGGATIALRGGPETQPSSSSRPAILAGNRIELEVIPEAPAPGTRIDGPAVLELPESTLLIPDGWFGVVEPTGSVRMARARA